MANRVGVNINANDLTRSGLRSVRNSVRRMQRQLPNSHRIYVNLNDDATRAGIRRVQRAVRGLPDNVFVNVRLNEPSRADRNRIRNSINNAVRGPGRSLGGFFSGLTMCRSGVRPHMGQSSADARDPPIARAALISTQTVLFHFFILGLR